jgi:hypothetical protein
MQGQPRPWWHKWLAWSERNERFKRICQELCFLIMDRQGGCQRKKPDKMNVKKLNFQESLKGQCHEIFVSCFFSWIIFSKAPENNMRVISNFFENSWKYSKVKVHTVINDTGGRFATGVKDKFCFSLLKFYHAVPWFLIFVILLLLPVFQLCFLSCSCTPKLISAVPH